MRDKRGTRTQIKLGSKGVSRRLTIATVDEIRPNDHFLREAEDPESSTLEMVVEDVTGVSYHVLALEDAEADETNLGAVKQQPAISGLLLPADVAWVFPQQFDLKEENIQAGLAFTSHSLVVLHLQEH